MGGRLKESRVRTIVNAIDHRYRLACFAYAFHSAPRLSGGAADPSRSARLCIQRTSITPTWRLAPLSAQSSAFAPYSRQVCRLIGHTSTDSSCSDLEVLGLYQYVHPTKPGKVTLAYHKGDFKRKTVQSVIKQAGLKSGSDR